MARGGIYKAEVLRARDKLLAIGQYPSIDAVRSELGNTGSKSTIHRYLKEIEEEEGAPTGTKVAVSEALQDLIGRLAGRLHEEADERIIETATRHKAQLEQQAEAITALKKESEAFRHESERAQLTLAEERAQHEQTAAHLQAASLERAQLAQQVADLQERLAGEAQHRQSLEEKHQHAREALEHFRQSVKEQREQEQRQHDQQIQYLQGEVRKLTESLAQQQHEVIHSNQENARLTSQVARAESDLHEAQTELRNLRQAKEQLVSSERHADELRRQVAQQSVSANELLAAKNALETQSENLVVKMRQLEIDLASAQAAATTEDQIAGKIRALVEAAVHGNKDEAKPKPAKSRATKDQETPFKTGG